MPLVPRSHCDDSGKPRPTPQLTTLDQLPGAASLVNGERPYPDFEVRDLLASIGSLRCGQPPNVDPALFKDKIVFVGLTHQA